MKAKTAIGGLFYLICAGLSGSSLFFQTQSSSSTLVFIGSVFALVWIFAAIWAFRELGNVYFTQYNADVDRHYDYDLIIVTASKRVANQSSIGFLAGIGMIILVVLLEVMYNPQSLLTNTVVQLNLIAGVLSIVASQILKSLR